MKRLLLLLALLPAWAHAQDDAVAKFSLIVDYTYNSFDNEGLNRFFTTFNNYWGAELSASYEEQGTHIFSHPNFGVGFRYIGTNLVGFTAASDFLYGGRARHTYATWANGVQDHLRMRVRDFRWTIHMGVAFNQTLFLEGYAAAHPRSLKFDYSTIYQDGSESFGSEYKLNGVYTGTTTGFDLGLQAGLSFSYGQLFVRFAAPLGGFPPGKGEISLTDYTSNDYPPNDFPTDYGIWAEDPLQFVEQDLGLRTDDLLGKAWTFGIEIYLNR